MPAAIDRWWCSFLGWSSYEAMFGHVKACAVWVWGGKRERVCDSDPHHVRTYAPRYAQTLAVIFRERSIQAELSMYLRTYGRTRLRTYLEQQTIKRTDT